MTYHRGQLGAPMLMTMHRYLPVLAIALILTGCSSPAAEAEPTVEPTPQRVEVPWPDYAPSVKQDIDAATEAGDCAALNEQFSTADANNDLTAARTDHNNADLMRYIAEASDIAGC